jgi:SAM-dependent methyltransferase
MPDQIQFNDGAAYERYMGHWSQLVAHEFLNWLDPGPDLRWLDVGCGNGAFTQTIVDRCAPKSVDGIDPSEGQLAYAAARPASRLAKFQKADAMALPFPNATFDIAVMPLVIFFVPDPARGVAEMARVVAPGGQVTAYAWDMPGGGFPYAALHDEMRSLGHAPPQAPSQDASRIDVMQDLWRAAGLADVQTRAITVRRTFANFEDYWTTIQGGPSVGKGLAKMPADTVALLKSRMRERFPADLAGRITYTARANAAKGRVPR